MSRAAAYIRQGVPVAPCLHRYVAPRNRRDFRQRISDPCAFAVRLAGACADVDWDLNTNVIRAFGRDSKNGFAVSIAVPNGSVHATITNAPTNHVDFHKLLGGLSVGGFPFQSEHPPYVIEPDPGPSNYLVWRAANSKMQHKLIRRKHCYVSSDPLPPDYAVVWDRFPGHGLLVNTAPVPMTDIVTRGRQDLFVMPGIESDMTWNYAGTVLMMSPDDYADLLAGKPAPPVPEFMDERFAAAYGYLSEYAATADLDQDADDAFYLAELLCRHPDADFDAATDYLAVDAIAAMSQLLLNSTACTDFDDEFEDREELAGRLSAQIAGLPRTRFHGPTRYPSISLQ